MSSPVCPHCGVSGSGSEEEDSAYQTLVCGTAFKGDREALARRVGTCDTSDLVRHMLELPASWWTVVDFTEAVLGI